MRLHVQLLLGLVQCVDTLFEELVLHTIILLLRVCDLLGRLVVTELASLSQHGDIGRRVDLLQHHLELVEEAEGDAPLALHNFVNHLRVELNVEVA